MLKLLRKYNKFILAIGGALLMIVFLLPQGFQQLGSGQSSFKIAELAGGRSVTEGELLAADHELKALRDLDLRLQGRVSPNLVMSLVGLSGEPAREHWWLLTHEASRGGFLGGPADADQFLRLIALRATELFARQGFVPQDQVQEFMDSTHQQLRDLRDMMAPTPAGREVMNGALAKAAGVHRMLNEHLSAATISTPEAIAAGRRFLDSAVIDFAVLDATADLKNLPEPTEEQVRAQFERYKNVLAEQDPRGFGYAQAAAIKLSSLRLSRRAIEQAVKLDPVAVRVHWEKHKQRLGADFSTARAAVEQELRRTQVESILSDAERFVQTEILKGERTLAHDGGFRALPENWSDARPDFEVIQRALFEHVKDKHGVAAQISFVEAQPLWLSQPALRSMGGIASTQLLAGGKRIDFADWAFNVREINPDAPYAGQVGVVAPPLRLPETGDVFFGRVNEARPMAFATDIERSRPQVEADLLKLASFDRLVARSDEIRAKAAESFEPAILAIAGGVRIDRGASVSRQGISLSDGTPAPENINTEPVRDAILKAAAALDPTVATESLPALGRTLVIPLPDWLSVAVVRITSVRPLSVETFRMVGDQLARSAAFELRTSPDWAFSLESLKARHGFEFVGQVRRAQEEHERQKAAQEQAAGQAATPAS